ncbi:GTP cyclohydrolase [Flavobacterium sp.]|uniref:GTP cyclohydrolase n=1 Tax=Flavobacterium sp. TaxID=239 RepID=UPI00286E0FB1|nr:GTP cyclohydrolase [Flavobacterium sp.]
MIVVKNAISKKEMIEFVTFPFSIYKNNTNWVPPIIADELESFDKTKNPVFESAEAYFYIAYKNDIPVGRIAAIVNWDEVKNQQKNKVRFGWFDTVDDIEVTKSLLEKVYELGKKHHLEYVEGPMGFSNLDKVGVLTEGFDQLGNMITWYNHEYYKHHFEKLGFVVEKKYIESVFNFSDIDNLPIHKASLLIQKRYGLKSLIFTKTKDVMPYVDKMFDLFNQSYEKLESFVAINEIQKEYFKKKYINFINPEFIQFIVDEDNKMVAFAIVMPNFAQALQKSKGKLFPFGFLHLLQARKNSKEVLFYLIGILPEYQNKGVTAIIFDEYHNIFSKKGIIKCIRTPELENNIAIQNLWKNFNPKINKRRCTYRKNL